jgi:hypothetical protein
MDVIAFKSIFVPFKQFPKVLLILQFCLIHSHVILCIQKFKVAGRLVGWVGHFVWVTVVSIKFNGSPLVMAKLKVGDLNVYCMYVH